MVHPSWIALTQIRGHMTYNDNDMLALAIPLLIALTIHLAYQNVVQNLTSLRILNYF